MNSFLLWIGGLLVAVLAALFAVPHLVDWNSWRGVFEEEASRVLARDVRLSGNVNLRLLPTPYVRFEKLRIANADGRAGEPFLRAEALTIGLSVAPLLRGAIEANDVEIDRPVLRLTADAQGSGNWANFEVTPGALPFVPTDVVLQSVKVRDGTIVFDAAGTQAALTAINAEIEATALAGPYKVRADAKWNGDPREIRLSTAAREADGSIRAKVTVRAPASGNSYGFDGTVADLWGRTRYDGQASARLPIAGTGARDDAFDVRGAIAGDVFSVALSDLTVAYEKEGRPQTLTGLGRARWSGPLEIETRWQSKWLDLDGLRRNTAQGPLALAKDLAERAVALVPAEGTTRAVLDVEQVNVGGDAVTNVRIDAASSGGALRISELKAGLPGGTRLDLKGTVAGTSARAFEGDIVLRGSSLRRFAAWASGQPAPAVKADGSFLLSSGLGLGTSRVTLTRATAEFGGTQFSGAIDYDWTKEPALDLKLEGAKVDLGPLSPGFLEPGALAALFTAAPQAEPAAEAVGFTRLLGVARRDLKLAIRADLLIDGARQLRDVDARLSRSGGKLDIAALSFVTPAGLRIEAEGSLASVADAPQGAIRGTLVAPTPAALADVETVLGGRFGSGRIARLPVPSARVAFTAQFGGRVREALDLHVDGLLTRSRVEGALTLAGGLDGWRKAPIEAVLTVDGPDTGDVLRLIRTAALGTVVEPAPPGGTPVLQGRLALRAAGKDAAALGFHAELDSEPLSGSLHGSARIDGAILLVEADADVVAASLGDLLQASGVKRRPNLDGVGLDGVVGVRTAPGELVLSPRGVKLGGALVSGSVALRTPAPDKPLAVDARLRADQASVQGLMRVLAPDVPAADPGIDAPAEGPWPDDPFALAWTDDVIGRVALKAETLTIASGLALADATLEAEVKSGRIDIARLDGAALAGRVAVAGGIERAQAGASASLGVRLEKFDLARLPIETGARPSGAASLSLTVQGRGLSPRALVSALTGKGEIALEKAQVPILTPRLVAQSVSAVLAAAEPPAADAFTQRVATARAGLDLGTRKVAVDVADGALKIARLALDVPEGRIVNQTTVELATLRADSDTRVEARVPELKVGNKPGGVTVGFVHVGPLAALSTTVARIEADAAEREITVRRMERDVERLEQLRRDDAARATLQQQQLQQQQQQQQQQLQPGPQGQAPVDADPRSVAIQQPSDTSGGGTAEGTYRPADARPQPAPKPVARPAPRQMDPFAQGDPIEALKRR